MVECDRNLADCYNLSLTRPSGFLVLLCVAKRSPGKTYPWRFDTQPWKILDARPCHHQARTVDSLHQEKMYEEQLLQPTYNLWTQSIHGMDESTKVSVASLTSATEISAP